MERLAWVEILDRHGDVAIRHPVHAWPLRVGRAYSSDIVLDDPYVAAHHLKVSPAEKGLFQLNIVDSSNAMTIGKLRGKQSDATISADQVVRIGQTQLRFRPVDYAVSAEKPLLGKSWSRSWPALLTAVTVLVLVYLLTLWLNYDRADSYNILVTPVIGAVVFLLVWSSFWALIGRVLSGHANFIAHTVNAFLGFALLIFLELSYGYMDFAFDTDLMTRVASVVLGMLIVGTLAYRHVALVSRIGRRKLAAIVAAMMVCLTGLIYASEAWDQDAHLTDMSFPGVIGPPSISLTHGLSTEAFIGEADKLKTTVDDYAKSHEQP